MKAISECRLFFKNNTGTAAIYVYAIMKIIFIFVDTFVGNFLLLFFGL